MNQKSLAPAVIGALGVVYGDIGTSPLYAFREAFAAAQGAPGDRTAILGVLSLIFWSLALVVTLKYVTLVLRADNRGEGGILSLAALAQRQFESDSPWPARILVLGMVGTALFYCDALITPAISIVSAVEGLEVLDESLARFVVPLTLVVVIGLFAIQKRGTATIGRLFGPIMVLWFLALAVTGIVWIARNPGVLAALNPGYGLGLLGAKPALALVIIGAVFLAVTGGEALYADMGHFGRVPVRIAWLGFVWPSLLLNYFGQGALMLDARMPVQNVFFAMSPPILLGPLVALATAATIIASQATISGAFSVTRQAVQLDLLPRLRIVQTSSDQHGQIYVPAVNALMLVAVVLFVLGFRSSSALSGAYGAAVVGTMFVTTLLGALVARTAWRWRWPRVVAVCGLLALVDFAFIAGNVTKIPEGGWVPLLLATLMYGVFVIWRDGRRELRAALVRRAVEMSKLPALLAEAQRVPGTAVYLVSQAGYVPTAMLRNLEHNKVYHEQNIILHLDIARQPRIDPLARTQHSEVMAGVHVVRAQFGFMEPPSVGEALRCAHLRGLHAPLRNASYFVGWHLVKPTAPPGPLGWKQRAFGYLQRRSAQAAEFFQMPSERVVVLATELELRQTARRIGVRSLTAR
jgi:KUP system potassium uptake protein